MTKFLNFFRTLFSFSLSKESKANEAIVDFTPTPTIQVEEVAKKRKSKKKIDQ